MPRKPRQISESGIYHIMLRGINQQVIFEDEEDYFKFISTLEIYKAISGYKVFAYCLMSNHIHILLKTEKEDLDLIMKRIAGSYVYWYNWKYHRSGHLFQDRFKSEPVDDDSYFLTVLRYIHQNPTKAKLCKLTEDYPYSSMREYMKYPVLSDTSFALSMLTLQEFVEFHQQQNDDQCMEVDDKKRLTDEDARALILKITKCRNAAEFQQLEKAERNECIRKLHDKGISIRQISRLTGLSKRIVEWNL